MDYKKKYEQALERAKIYNSNNTKQVVKDLVTYIFPELKESKDERIRKAIRYAIGQSTHSDGTLINEVSSEEALVWFEKQGEKPKEVTCTHEVETGNGNIKALVTEKVQLPKFKVGDVMRTLQEATDGYTDGMPVVVSIDKEYYHCTNELIAIKDQDDYEYPPMNRATAWREEDEEMLRDAIGAVGAADYYTYDDKHKIERWLNTLKERIKNGK